MLNLYQKHKYLKKIAKKILYTNKENLEITWEKWERGEPAGALSML